MIENTFEQIVGLKEIQVDQVELHEKRIDLYCSSVLEEALCPSCLKKQPQVNQTYEQQIRDVSVTGKEVYLHLTTRPFDCPECDRYCTERVHFFEPNRTMTRRYEQYLYEGCKGTTLQNVSAQEHRVWNTLNDIFQRYRAQEWQPRDVSVVRVVGMDEFALKTGHRNFATVMVDVEQVEIIDMLEYREQENRITDFNDRGQEWWGRREVFGADRWPGCIGTGRAVFPNATIVVDRCHVFHDLNPAVDNQRQQRRQKFNKPDDCKRLKWALLKHPADLTAEEKKKLARAFFWAPELKQLDEHKAKRRTLFDQHITREPAETHLDRWVEEARKLNTKYLNSFIKTLNNWKAYVLNYFTHRFTTRIIEGINHSIKVIKRMGYGFRNFGNFKQRILVSFA